MCEHFRLYVIHQLGEHARRPIAHFWLWPLRLTFVSLTLASTETSLSSRPVLLLLNHIGSHAASSPLQGASAFAHADCFAGLRHAARNPCSTLRIVYEITSRFILRLAGSATALLLAYVVLLHRASERLVSHPARLV
jgi:hypothetical protein